jgi:hypothetical protein
MRTWRIIGGRKNHEEGQIEDNFKENQPWNLPQSEQDIHDDDDDDEAMPARSRQIQQSPPVLDVQASQQDNAQVDSHHPCIIAET